MTPEERDENDKIAEANGRKIKQAYTSLNTHEGRLIIRDLYEKFEFNEPSFSKMKDYNPYAAAFHDGARAVMNRILQQSAPTQHHEQSKEA